VHAPYEDKSNDKKDGFNDELEPVLDQFSKYYMNILLGNFNAEVRKEDIFKPTVGNENSD
jgi:hypothetical protein